MKANIKKLIAIVLAVALCMGLGAPALAGGEPLASGPSFFVDELYYPLDLDDKGEGWYYTAATRTLTIENFNCNSFGLYSYYTEENLYVEMVGDNNYCDTHARSICYPTSADQEGGDIIFVGDGSLTVHYTLLGRDFEFHGGTVSTSGITVNAHPTVLTIYDGATLNISTAGSNLLLRQAGVAMNGGTLNVDGAYYQDIAETSTFTVNAGTINVVSLDGDDALKVAPTIYDALLASGVSITSGDGAETMLNTEGQNNRIRLASDTESKLSTVRLTGAGEPVAAPERPTTGETTDTTEPTTGETTDPTTDPTAAIGEGDIAELVAMATDAGIDISTLNTALVRMYAAELGVDLSAYSDEQLTALLAEAAALQKAESGESTEPTVSFTDVAPGAWYHDTVIAAANAGIVAGNADGTFAPDGILSWAQAITFAVRLMQYQAGEHIYGAADQAGYPNWYDIYTAYALENGIIDSIPSELNAPITRGDAAIIFAAVLGSAPQVNTVADGTFTDIESGTAVSDAVYALATAGIVNGKVAEDGSVYFDAVGNFRRSEVASIVSRMAGLVDPVVIG